MQVNRPADGASSESANPSGPATLAEMVAALPPHLGWGGAPITAAIRAAQQRQQETAVHNQVRNLPHCPQPNYSSSAPSPDALPPSEQCVKLFPDIALGMLRQEQVAPGRVWLLLRHLDSEGRGWLRIDIIREQLTHKDSALRLCGWRQLRNLLRQGEGIFWRRDKTHLWLRSAGKAAAALGVARLVARPVALALKILRGGIGSVRAHFYASFHSGRRSQQPISRRTLEAATRVAARTQRLYERETGVKRRRNMAIGERYSAENVQKRAWAHGKASFDFIDHHGRQGPEKRHYIAWHLPNSYRGCHDPSPKGRMQKINRQIDLVNKRARAAQNKGP